MAKTRRVIRRVERAEVVGFDDHRWPINLTLLAIAGVLAYFIVSDGSFDDPRPLHNGIVQLVTLTATVGLLIWAVTALSHVVARRLQLAVLISLIAHVGLIFFLRDRYLSLDVVQADKKTQVQLIEERPEAPEYFLQSVEQNEQRHTFEHPVETVTPSQTVEELERTSPQPKETQALKTPNASDAVEPEVTASPVELRRLQLATPRQANEMSRLSRSISSARTSSETATNTASPSPKLDEPKETPQPNESTPLDRQEIAHQPNQQAPSTEVNTAQPQVTVTQEQPVLRQREPLAADAPSESTRSPSRATRQPSQQTAQAATAEALAAQTPQSIEEATSPGIAAAQTNQRRASNSPAAISSGAASGTSRQPNEASLAASVSLPKIARRAATTGQPHFGKSSPTAPRRSVAAAAGPAMASAPKVSDAGTSTARQTTASGRQGEQFRPSSSTLQRSTTFEHVGAAGSGSAPLAPTGGGQPAAVATGPSLARRAAPQDLAATGNSGSGSASLRRRRSAPSATGSTAQAIGPSVAAAPPLPPSTGASKSASGSGLDVPQKLSGDGRAEAMLPVRVAASPGIGGLGEAVSVEVGLPSRRANRDSEVVHRRTGRYLQKKVGGKPAPSGPARIVAEAFVQRGRDRHGAQAGGDGKPSARTEAAIERGLEYLAKRQSPNGSWSFHRNTGPGSSQNEQPGSIHSDTAATGLSLLAFLGAGYDHFDGKYQDTVNRGLKFLVDKQQENGLLYLDEHELSNQSARFYSHAIATIALCEALGMTGDEELREPAGRAIGFIINSQHPDYGGWRYQLAPNQGSDLSVTGWQTMALKSGQLAGIKVPKEVFTRITEFLDSAEQKDALPGRFAYDPNSVSRTYTRNGKQFETGGDRYRKPSTVMTSVGLLMRLYLGDNREDESFRTGAAHLLANLPTNTRPTGLTGTINNPQRDTYYWYYATQVMFHMQGEHWKKWNGALHPLLVNSQQQGGPLAGSWDPRRPVPDRWGAHGGRLYVTSMNLLSLEVFYRHLPIYEDTAN